MVSVWTIAGEMNITGLLPAIYFINNDCDLKKKKKNRDILWRFVQKKSDVQKS